LVFFLLTYTYKGELLGSKKEVLINSTTWMNFEDIVLNEVSRHIIINIA
jgi:hypothetical protein